MAIRGKMKSLVKKLIVSVPLATALFFSPVNANQNPLTEKINSPEYAEEVRTDQSGYKHWRFGDVWYSNAPLKEYSEDKIKSLSKTSDDTISYEDIRMNPFSQPNDSNLVWYGSGDVDSNNVRDWNDHNLIQQGIQNDQADIDGDGILGTPEDADLFTKYLNGDTLLPQVSWNWEICSKEDRKIWLEKMLTIDKTDTITYDPEYWICGNFSKQLRINFNGYGEVIKDSLLLEEIDPDYKYSFLNNGRFNIPVFGIRTRGPPHHAINACLIGENPLVWDDWYFFEPQDDKQIIIGDWNMADSSTVKIYHSYFCDFPAEQRKIFLQQPFIEFKLTDGNPEFIKKDDRLILERPYVNSIKPEKLNLLEKFVLNQNYPNPFNSNTTIKYSIPLEDNINIGIYDITGKLVETLVNEKQDAGKYFVDLNSQGLSSGIYLYRMETSAGAKNKKMMLVK